MPHSIIWTYRKYRKSSHIQNAHLDCCFLKMFKTVYAIYHAYIWTTAFEYTAQFFRYDTNSFAKEIVYQKCACLLLEF